MFDARYLAFAAISALLVITPGATMAVVMEAAVSEGRVAALHTVLGVNIANSTLALCSALGLSYVFSRWPWTLQLVKAEPAMGSGAMSGVTYIQRLDTKAGIAPATACDASAKGKQEKVGYEARYVFYRQ